MLKYSLVQKRHNVEVLTQKEMGETTGEFWWIFIPIAAGVACMLIKGCGGGPIYQKTIPF